MERQAYVRMTGVSVQYGEYLNHCMDKKLRKNADAIGPSVTYQVKRERTSAMTRANTFIVLCSMPRELVISASLGAENGYGSFTRLDVRSRKNVTTTEPCRVAVANNG